jgi:hypothetical protein
MAMSWILIFCTYPDNCTIPTTGSLISINILCSKEMPAASTPKRKNAAYLPEPQSDKCTWHYYPSKKVVGSLPSKHTEPCTHINCPCSLDKNMPASDMSGFGRECQLCRLAVCLVLVKQYIHKWPCVCLAPLKHSHTQPVRALHPHNKD